MKNEEMKESLCYRCEHRARFLENGYKPRHECGEVNQSKWSCYMYKPVRPVVMTMNKNENRPYGMPIISGRAHISRSLKEDELILKMKQLSKKDFILLWDLKESEELKK